jgi:hypothetical protein
MLRLGGSRDVLCLFATFCLTPILSLGDVTPNSNTHYRALRDAVLDASGYQVENLILKRDAAEIHLRKGVVAFIPAVLDQVVCGVFVGEGEFRLEPTLPEELDYLDRLLGEERVTDSFDRLVIWFTDETYQEIVAAGSTAGVGESHRKTLEELRNRLRSRRESPRSFLEDLLAGSEIANQEAEILADLLNRRAGIFDAFIFGSAYKDLRFRVRPLGALPQLPSPEEVALLHLKPGDNKEGILYLAHYLDEYTGGRADNGEDKRRIDVEHYRLDTSLDGGKLSAEAEIRFAALEPVRMIGFGLLPSLRVSGVEGLDGTEVEFIQEPEKSDGAFHVILPAPLGVGETATLKLNYQGDKVVEDAGGGNWAVGARSSWYPSVAAFADRATFDLTFRFSSNLELVSVGEKVSETKEKNRKVARWVTETPIGVAGFNCGQFKRKEVRDQSTGYALEGYAVRKLPDYLYGAQSIGGMSPTRLLDNAMVDGQNSIRVFTHWFGESPYGRIAITQQPQLSFGQSWPSLVYLPIIAFFDSTQRWQLFDTLDRGITSFVEEVTPHEVAHQWWGHLVGWASFHDQWLSEGFADFSASLFLEATSDSKRVDRFWEDARKSILEVGVNGRANDAGPIWQGLRLSTNRVPGAYQRLAYQKGAYVVHMLRRMMWDRETGDAHFRAMVQEFVASHLHANATTEGFKSIVEKHMPPVMDLDGNGRLDWYFNQWVYGTEVPSYNLRYVLEAQQDGKVLMTATVSQSGVSDDFKMLVPLYGQFNDQWHRLGQATLTGSTSTPEFKVLLPSRPKGLMVNAFHDILAVESRSSEIMSR